MSCPRDGSIEGFEWRTGSAARFPGQVRHGLGRIFRVEDHPEPVLVIGWVARRLRRNDRLDVGGLEDLLETHRHAGGYRSDGRTPPPRIEPPGGQLFWERFRWFFMMLARSDPPMIAASWGDRTAADAIPCCRFQTGLSAPEPGSSPSAIASKSHIRRPAGSPPTPTAGRSPLAAPPAGSETPLSALRPTASAIQATAVDARAVLHGRHGLGCFCDS
jgi:hypothetical protein